MNFFLVNMKIIQQKTGFVLRSLLALGAGLLSGINAQAFVSRHWIGQDRGSWSEPNNWIDDSSDPKPGVPDRSIFMTYIRNGTTAIVENDTAVPDISILNVASDELHTSSTSGLILNDNLTIMGGMIGAAGSILEVYNPGEGRGSLTINNAALNYLLLGVGIGVDGSVMLNNGRILATTFPSVSNPDDPDIAVLRNNSGTVAFGNEAIKLLVEALGGSEPPELSDIGNLGLSMLAVGGTSTIEANAVHFSGNSRLFLGMTLGVGGGFAPGSTLAINTASALEEEEGNVYFYDGATIVSFDAGSNIVLGEGMTLDLTNVTAATWELDEYTGLPATGLNVALINFESGQAYELIRAANIVLGDDYSVDNINDLFTILLTTFDEDGSLVLEDSGRFAYAYVQGNSIWVQVIDGDVTPATLGEPVVSGNTITIDVHGGAGNYYALYSSSNLLGAADSWTFVSGTAGQIEEDGTATLTFEKGAATAEFYRLVTSADELDGTTINDDARYSTNVAGRYTVSVPARATRLISIQVQKTQVTSLVGTLFSGAPNGTVVWIHDRDGVAGASSSKSLSGWSNPNLELSLGTIATVKAAASAVNINITGVITAGQVTHSLTAGGSNYFASWAPISGLPDSLGISKATNDRVNYMNKTDASWSQSSYSLGSWKPAIQAVSVGEAINYTPTTAREFTERLSLSTTDGFEVIYTVQ